MTNRKTSALRLGLWLGLGIVAVAAAAATGAFGAPNGGTITTIAGGGNAVPGDGGPATSVKLWQPEGVAVDGRGNVYIADNLNSRVRKVSPNGTITTFAGTAARGYSGDNVPAASTQLNWPRGVAVDGQGNVYIADTFNDRVRKVSGGTITTVAGTGRPGRAGDGGPATSAQLSSPRGVAVDGQGNLYIADFYYSRVRKVSPGGTITTLAGADRQGFSGDGGSAASALLNHPLGVAVDKQGNVYIADTENDRVRKVSAGGTITTFAGTGSPNFSGDGGPASSAGLVRPAGVAVDGQGNVYIAERHRVRKVNPRGTITTLAGSAGGSFSGDGGPATSARLNYPASIAVDGQGNIYIADSVNNRVRKIAAGPSTTAALKLSLGGASPQRRLAQEGVTITARCSRPCALVATGSVKIVGTNYVFGLTRATGELASGRRTLTLRLPGAQQKRFRQLLKPSLRARATIAVKATDRAGSVTTSKRTVMVQR